MSSTRSRLYRLAIADQARRVRTTGRTYIEAVEELLRLIRAWRELPAERVEHQDHQVDLQGRHE